MNDDSHLMTIFAEALDHSDPLERAAYLTRVCGGDAALQARVEELLKAHAAAGGFLNPEAGTTVSAIPEATGTSPPDAETGSSDGSVVKTSDHRPTDAEGLLLIGRYKLVEEIGEGGMGSVWMAQQTEPVKRAVAVKLIKAGMDSRAVLARFEAERQALALMDHPNIAKVLDGGATGDGRPFFVMELVKGVPITKFCDERRLTTRQRLELFVPVCQAVQHAHQKGIIHRDIKPNNVLVALYDDRPVPKVIDFGIAKATGQPLTDRTLMTGFGAVVGTPEYMSPEQANFNNLDIDTRSDVYALGVLLYELLAGSPPFTRKDLEKAGLLEILRVIREQEPPRPSTKLSTADALPSLAANRQTEPRRLTAMVRGELDWIVMKALEKDRNRRYESANGFAADVQRYLADEPVAAGPPSSWYRLRKFVKRNKGQVLAGVLLASTLMAGVVGTTIGLFRALAAESEAREQARVAGEERDRAKVAIEAERKAKLDAEASATAERLAKEVTVKRLGQIERGNEILASIFRDLNPRAVQKGSLPLNALLAKRLEKAAALLVDDKIGDPLVVASLQTTLGNSSRELGYPKLAIELLTQARKTRETILGLDATETLTTLNNLAAAYQTAGRTADALALFGQVRDMCEKKVGPDHPDTLSALQNLASANRAAGRTADAIGQLERVRAACEKAVGSDHRDTLAVMNNLADAYREAGRTTDAIRLYERIRDAQDRQLEQDHPDRFITLNNLGNAYLDAGRTADAIQIYEQVRDAEVKALGADHPDTLITSSNLGHAYQDAGRTADAVRLLERVRDSQQKRPGPDHPDTLITLSNLALSYQDAGRNMEAIQLLERVRDAKKQSGGLEHPDTLTMLSNLGASYVSSGRAADAIELLERVRDSQTKLRGPDHPDTLRTLNNLAQAYGEVGRKADALALLERLRVAYEKNQGINHPEALTTLNNLADAYRGVGRVALAIKLLEQVRDARVKSLGPRHPSTLTTLNNLAAAYRDAGRHPEALKLFEQVRDVREEALGPNHPDTLTTLNNLALEYRGIGRDADAVKLLERVWEAEVKVLGPDHPHTIITLSNLADGYRTTGRRAEAVKLFEQLRGTAEKVFGKDHQSTLIILNNLASAYQDAGRLAEAIRLYEQVRDSNLKMFGKNHPDTLRTLNNLGGAYRISGRTAEAVEIFEYLRDANRKVLGPDHPYTLASLHNLAAAYFDDGRTADAFRLWDAVVMRAREILGQAHPFTLHFTRAWINALESDRQFAKAADVRRDLLAIERKQYPPDDPKLAASLALVAYAMLKANRPADAEPMLRECMTIREKKEPDSWTRFNTQSLLGGSLLGQGKYADAEPLLLSGCNEMKDREAKIPPDSKVRLSEAVDRLVELYIAWDKPAEAAKWREERKKYPPEQAPRPRPVK